MFKNKLINCKTCNAEVSSSAKVCPHCGAKLKIKHKLLKISLICIGFFILVCLFGSSDSPPPTKVNNVSVQPVATLQTPQLISQAPSETPKTTTEPTIFTVGDSIDAGGLITTLVGFTESTGSKYNEPTDGKIFVIVEFEIQNNKNRDKYISSLDFHASCDGYAVNDSFSASLEKGDKTTISGNVFSGQKTRGVICYELPINWGNLEIHFAASSSKKDTIIFKIPHNPQ